MYVYNEIVIKNIMHNRIKMKIAKLINNLAKTLYKTVFDSLYMYSDIRKNWLVIWTLIFLELYT